MREFIADGAIGAVHEVQVWSPARFWACRRSPAGRRKRRPFPTGLDWDLWLGPAPSRPYHPAYCPWTWRNWWDFGTGLFGDLGCHKLSTVFKALQLGHPVSVEACSTVTDGEIYPCGRDRALRISRPRRHAPATLDWYDGGLRPPSPGTGAGPRDRRRHLLRRQGRAHGPSSRPGGEDAGLRPAAEEAASFARTLQGVRRRLPRRRNRPARTSSITAAC